jgi:hypothetical protein
MILGFSMGWKNKSSLCALIKKLFGAQGTKSLLFAVLIPTAPLCVMDFLADLVRKDRDRFMVEAPVWELGQEKR